MITFVTSASVEAVREIAWAALGPGININLAIMPAPGGQTSIHLVPELAERLISALEGRGHAVRRLSGS